MENLQTLKTGFALEGKFTPEQLEQLRVEDFPKILQIYNDKFEQSQGLDNIIPKQFSSESQLELLTNRISYSSGTSDLKSLTMSLCDPIWELFSRGGKRIRPVLCFILSELYGQPWTSVLCAASCCESIHNASLLVDDVEDDSQLRRNKPCVHKIYGVDITVNAGNFLYFAPFYRLLQDEQVKNDPQISSQLTVVYLEEMINLHLGQGWDILWHNQEKLNGRVPLLEQYLQMVSYKTGVLLRVSARMTAILLKLAPELQSKLGIFAERIGIGFQIQDDILNLVGEEYSKTKGQFGEDIHEGKMSLVAIHALNTLPKAEKDRLQHILLSKTSDQSIINEAITLMQKSDSINYARKVATDLIRNAWDDISESLPNNKYKHILNLFAQFCSERKI